MSEITSIHARQILDSRGNPTVEVDVVLAGRVRGRAAVPSGASTGRREVVELRDDASAFLGRGVSRAVENVNTEIADAVVGRDSSQQVEIDAALIDLDGSDDKGRLGANAILGVSLAVARAHAIDINEPLWRTIGDPGADLLPIPMMNVLNGGAHADNPLDVQEFMIVPHAAGTFTEALRMGVETYQHLRRILHTRGLFTAVGDEGGFAPDLHSNEHALQMLVAAITAAGYVPGEQISIALDPAASGFRDDGTYHLRSESLTLTSEELIDYWERLIDRFPIVALEDGLAEDDWDGWRLLTKRLGDRVQLIGDDIFVTNPTILQHGIDANIANAILIKPNQIGTITETLDTITLAHGAGYGTVISHRSGETTDTTISDLAVATGAGQIKSGAPCRGERVAKYNQLLRIEEQLGSSARYGNRLGSAR